MDYHQRNLINIFCECVEKSESDEKKKMKNTTTTNETNRERFIECRKNEL